MDPDTEPPPLSRLSRARRFFLFIIIIFAGTVFVAASGGKVTGEFAMKINQILSAHLLSWGAAVFWGIVALLGSAHFKILNYSLFSLDSEEIQDLLRSRPRSARLLIKLRKNLDRTWFTLLAGLLVFNLVLALATASATLMVLDSLRIDSSWLRIPLIFLTSVASVLALGDILPGLLAARWLKAMAPFSARCVRVWSMLFFPITFLPLALLRQSARLRGLEVTEGYANLEVEKRLLTLIGVGRMDVSLEEEEREMIDHVLGFDQSEVRDIMTPRAEIVGLDISRSQEEALEFMRRVPRSRVLIFEESLDKIKGVLHTKQILLNPEKDYRKLAQEALFVEEDMDLVELLALMRARRKQIVVVLDEYGATAGVASFDDLLEAIVGQLPDDDEEPQAETIPAERGVK